MSVIQLIIKWLRAPGPDSAHLECECRAVAAVRQSREQRRLESQMAEWQLTATWSVGCSSWDLGTGSLVIITSSEHRVTLTWWCRPTGECRRRSACSPRGRDRCSGQPAPAPSPSSLSRTRYQPREPRSPCSSQPGTGGGWVNHFGMIQTLVLGARI